MRLSVASTLKNRGSTTAKDARILNGFAEMKGDSVRVFKRPAIVQTYAALSGGGQGLFPYGDEPPVVITGDVLDTAPVTVVRKWATFSQPVDWKITTAMSPAVVFHSVDAYGSLKATYTGTTTVAWVVNPASGVLSGTTSVSAVAGVATFSNLKFSKVGGGNQLFVSATGLAAGFTALFKIISSMVFTVQPSSVDVDTVMSPSVKVSVVDSSSAVITGFTGNITIAIGTNGGSPTAGVLTGTLTQACVAGVATFNNLQIDALGSGYTLVSSCTTANLVNKTSNAFNIQSCTCFDPAFDFSDIDSVDPTFINFFSWDGTILLSQQLVDADPANAFFCVTSCAYLFVPGVAADTINIYDNSYALLQSVPVNPLRDPYSMVPDSEGMIFFPDTNDPTQISLLAFNGTISSKYTGNAGLFLANGTSPARILDYLFLGNLGSQAQRLDLSTGTVISVDVAPLTIWRVAANNTNVYIACSNVAQDELTIREYDLDLVFISSTIVDSGAPASLLLFYDVVCDDANLYVTYYHYGELVLKAWLYSLPALTRVSATPVAAPSFRPLATCFFEGL